MIKTWTEEAEERGILEGQRKLLRKVLRAKFPDLSEGAMRRLDELPGERIEELGVALVNAKSLRELGLED